MQLAQLFTAGSPIAHNDLVGGLAYLSPPLAEDIGPDAQFSGEVTSTVSNCDRFTLRLRSKSPPLFHDTLLIHSEP